LNFENDWHRPSVGGSVREFFVTCLAKPTSGLLKWYGARSGA